MALYLSSRANSTRAELPSTIKETSVVSGGLSIVIILKTSIVILNFQLEFTF